MRSAGLTTLLAPLPASVDTATCLARSQFTGPPDHDSSFCSSANSGIWLAMSLGSSGSPLPPAPKPKPNGKLVMPLTVVATYGGRSGFRHPRRSGALRPGRTPRRR